MTASPPVESRVDLKAVRSGPPQPHIDRVVIHCTDSGRYPTCTQPQAALGTARYFAGMFGRPGGSAHLTVDTENTIRSLPDHVVAYHAPPNPRSWGIEIAGRAALTRDQWLSPACWPAIERAAHEVAAVCARETIPTVRLTVAEVRLGQRGICGHIDVSRAFSESDHWDPGPGFPWPEFMARVHFWTRVFNGAAPSKKPPTSPGETMALTPEETALLKAAANAGKPLVFRDSGTGYAYALQPHPPHLERVTSQDTINLMVTCGLWTTGNGTPSKLGTIATDAIRDLSGWVPNK